MDNIARVIRHAARQLWRAPLVSVASILTLAIGIGACTLMMSVVSTVLLKPLPYGDPDRLVMSWGWYPNANLGFPEQPTHGAVFSIMRDNTQAFESLAAFRGASFNFGDVISPERLDGIEATGDFFAALGVAPEIGHFFERANETPGSDHVAVLSDAVWRRRFGGDPHVLGRTLTLNAEPYTVIGVAATGFAFPRGPEMPSDFQFAATPDLWVPLRPPTGGVADLAIVGRLRRGVTDLQAREDMDRVMAVVQRSIPVVKSARPGQLLVPLRQQVVGDVQAMLASLLAAVLLVLVIACVNTAQLVLAQLHGRRRDLAIRAALGSSTFRLAGEVFAEVALLVAAGGVAGVAAGIAGLKLLRAFGSTRLPRAAELAFDARASFAALGVIALAAILVSVIPMLVDRRRPLVEILRGGGRGAGRGGLHLRVRRTLIVGELAGSLVLVTCAGLLVRSLSLQLEARRGFDAVRGVTFEVSLPPPGTRSGRSPPAWTTPRLSGFSMPHSTTFARCRACPPQESGSRFRSVARSRRRCSRRKESSPHSCQAHSHRLRNTRSQARACFVRSGRPSSPAATSPPPTARRACRSSSSTRPWPTGSGRGHPPSGDASALVGRTSRRRCGRG